MNICVLVPAYNEAEKLKKLLPQLKEYNLDIIVIDDGSRDETSNAAKESGVEVIRHEKNSGKGKALQTGFDFILKKNYDAVITMDADLQHDTCHIPEFIAAYETDNADIILGDRMLRPENMPRLRYWTNRFTSGIISILTGCHMRDTQSGFRLIKREVLREVKLSTSRFDSESELLIKAVALGFKVASIPVRTIYFDDHGSNIKPFVDTLRFIRLIIKAVFVWRK